MTAEKIHLVILGAGVSGLSAAYHLAQDSQYQITVLEKLDRVGGLATSFEKGPAIFDFGPHAFHSQEPHIVQFFQTLMEGQYREIQKDVAIKFQNKFYPYPLNPVQALKSMPLTSSIHCGLSYLWNMATNFRTAEDLKTAEDFFVRNFGWELYRLFFESYTHKVWGIHPSRLSAKFISNRLPSANLLRILWTALTGNDLKIRKPHEVPLNLHIFYPKKGSIQFPETLRRHVERMGGKVLLGATVTSVQVDGGKARQVTYRDAHCEHTLQADRVVSTIPLPELVQKMSPTLATDVLGSSHRLTFRPILIVCFWVNKPSLFKYQTIYYTNRIFNRLAQMNSYSDEVTPTGTCGITAELTCRENDELWNLPESEIAQRVLNDMITEGLLAAADVKEFMVLRNVHGYPIYDQGFEEHLDRLRNVVRAIPNLYILGRQGMFNYAQMHYGVSSGMKLAEHFRSGKDKPRTISGDSEDQFFA